MESIDGETIRESLARPEAFARIFDRHFDAIHGYLARRAGTGAADDLASLTFTVAFERRRSFRRSATSARPWLYGIATNLLRNDRRSEQRELRALAALAAGAADCEDGGDDRGADLAAALATLDSDHRDVLLLHAWADLSYEEVAGTLSIPIGTVRSRLSRARARVRAALAAAEPERRETLR